MIYFGGCYHLYHKNILKYGPRDFPDLETMRANCMQELKILRTEDTFIYLGDLWCHNEYQIKDFVESIPCKIKILVKGNHDKTTILAQGRFNLFNTMCEIYEFNYKNQYFVCSHYPLLSWNHQNHGSMMVHSHCHGNIDHLNKGVRRIDIGYDSSHKWLVSADEVMKVLGELSTPASNTTGN